MKQYWELKAQAGDALLLFRMGDFYELFADDAVEASRILEITLTSRDKNKPNPMPMAGVPHHSVQGYIQKLLAFGKKVAIGDQIEDPATVVGNKIVKRAVTRIFTPGVQFECEGSDANYLAALVREGETWTLACLDASTGETLVGAPSAWSEATSELSARPIKQLLVIESEIGAGALAELKLVAPDALIETLPKNYLAEIQAEALLKRQYETQSLDAFVQPGGPLRALAVTVQYALRTQQQERLGHLRTPAPLKRPATLVMGPRSPAHLDLLPTSDGAPSLFALINRTGSALGARALRRWMLAPLTSVDAIRDRQQAIRFLAGGAAATVAPELKEIYDIERILGRVSTGLANPRDTLALGRSLSRARGVRGALASAGELPGTLAACRAALEAVAPELDALAAHVERVQREDAPFVSRDGGIFNLGTDPELDRLIGLTTEGSQWLVQLEASEREKTGIPSLKVKYNRVFGYFIEITQAHLKNVPSHYQRKQTTVGAERFFTEELKKFEEEILTASSKQKSLEIELFKGLLRDIQMLSGKIMEAARAVAELDALFALSRLAGETAWCFPEIDDSLALEIVQGRHPLVDQSLRGALVPNDVRLSPETRLSLIITGPNMGGKSTIMRQTALIVILGQMGAPVPASSARWGVFSSVYTRIGAHDAIARGQSTFMVEMTELAHLIRHSDQRSLIVLDEIGRGTSTYDGISVAWSTLEWISTRIQARTLFATHYHELTQLVGSLPRLANAHMAVEGKKTASGEKLRFLYQLREGPANESFGIHVASLAGLPKPIIDRAWKVLADLEQSSQIVPQAQLSLFAGAQASQEEEPEFPLADSEPDAPVALPVWIDELRGLRVEEMTPIQALTTLAKLQESARAPG